jgi:hypothetical protein
MKTSQHTSRKTMPTTSVNVRVMRDLLFRSAFRCADSENLRFLVFIPRSDTSFRLNLCAPLALDIHGSTRASTLSST